MLTYQDMQNFLSARGCGVRPEAVRRYSARLSHRLALLAREKQRAR